MKNTYSFISGALCLLILLFAVPELNAQVQTARAISTGPNSNGFYEYLPQGYSSGNTRYPLIVFLHGVGELGNGGSDLPTVLRNGPPALISQGRFPASFTVNGKTSSFIVISPQFVAWPTNDDVDDVIEYALQNYRVDTGRVYLTGLSMGGFATWAYASDPDNAKMLAGLVPIAGGQLPNGQTSAGAIAKANLPVFAAANLNDPTVPSINTIDNINLINSIVPSINPTALDTIYNASGHGGWSVTYDPTIPMHNGLNIYEWMLQYTRNASEPVLPVKLTAYSAMLLTDKSRVAIDWTTSFEQNNKYFIVQRSADATSFYDLDTIPAAADAQNGSYSLVDPHPLSGNNFYRLVQVDLDAKATYFDVLKVVVPEDATGFHLSPNPTSGIIHLQLNNQATGPLEVRILDNQGKSLQTRSFRKQGSSWDQSVELGNIPAGNYFIRITGTGFRNVQGFIKN
jgi:predicted esterase